MHIASIGIDLGKTTFHLVALGERNKVLLRKKFSRSQLLAYTANLPSSLIGLEACAGSHLLGAVRCAICDWFNKGSRVAKPHRQFTFGVKSHSSTASQNRFPRPHL